MTRLKSSKDLFDCLYGRYFRGRDCELSLLFDDFTTYSTTVYSVPSIPCSEFRYILLSLLIHNPRLRYVSLTSSHGRGCTLLLRAYCGRLICLNTHESTTYGSGANCFMTYYIQMIKHFNVSPF